MALRCRSLPSTPGDLEPARMGLTFELDRVRWVTYYDLVTEVSAPAPAGRWDAPDAAIIAEWPGFPTPIGNRIVCTSLASAAARHWC